MSISTKPCAALAMPGGSAALRLATASSKPTSISACFSKFFGSMGIPAVAGVVVDRESCHGKGPTPLRKLAKAA